MNKSQLENIFDHIVRFFMMSMLLIVPLVFYTKTNDVFEINKITAFRILSLTAFTVFMLKKVTMQDWKFTPSAMWMPIAAVALTSVISTILTNNALTSMIGVYENFEGLTTILNYILLFIIVQQTTRNHHDVKKYFYIIIIAGTIATAYGIAQNFGIDIVRWNPNTYSAARMFGSLGNPNFLAAYALMSLPLAWMFFITHTRLSAKILFLMLSVVMVLAIFFTKSRGAFYGLAAEAIVFGIYIMTDYFRKGRLLQDNKRWLIIFAVMAGLTLLLPQVRHTVNVTLQRTVATMDISNVKMTPRLYIWKSALKMMVDKPLTGSGLDTFQITFPKYRLPLYWQLEWNGTPEKAHNFFLQIGATTGILGLGAWLWMLTVFFTMAFWQLKYLSNESRHLVMAIVLAQTGFIVQNQFNFTVVAYGSLFWFMLGLLPVIGRHQKEIKTSTAVRKFSPESLSRRQLLGVTAVLLLGMVTILWSLRVWSADIFFKRAMIYLALSQPQNAISELERAVKINPWREIYWVRYGIACETAAKSVNDRTAYLQKAESIHLHTISMNNLNGYNYNNLGRVYKFWGEYVDGEKLQAAENACRQAVARDPYNAYFNLDLATLLIALKKWDEVNETAGRLTELFPDFAMPYSYLGYVALIKNDMQKANESLSQAAEKNWRGDIQTRSSTMSNLGIVKANLGEMEGAIKAFDEAVQLRPDYVEARYNRAMVLEKIGKKDMAIRDYQIIISQAPAYQRVPEIKQRILQLERGTP